MGRHKFAECNDKACPDKLKDQRTTYFSSLARKEELTSRNASRTIRTRRTHVRILGDTYG